MPANLVPDRNNLVGTAATHHPVSEFPSRPTIHASRSAALTRHVLIPLLADAQSNELPVMLPITRSLQNTGTVMITRGTSHIIIIIVVIIIIMCTTLAAA
jgi:hypothetical protein